MDDLNIDPIETLAKLNVRKNENILLENRRLHEMLVDDWKYMKWFYYLFSVFFFLL